MQERRDKGKDGKQKIVMERRSERGYTRKRKGEGGRDGVRKLCIID